MLAEFELKLAECQTMVLKGFKSTQESNLLWLNVSNSCSINSNHGMYLGDIVKKSEAGAILDIILVSVKYNGASVLIGSV
jgi:hypothetical protein